MWALGSSSISTAMHAPTPPVTFKPSLGAVKEREGKERNPYQVRSIAFSCRCFPIGRNRHDPRHGCPRAIHVSSSDQQTLEAMIVHDPCCFFTILVFFLRPLYDVMNRWGNRGFYGGMEGGGELSHMSALLIHPT